MPVFRNLTGTSENSFQLGLGATVPILQRIGTTARLQLPNLLRFLPGGSTIQGWLKSDTAGDMTVVKSEFNKTVAPTSADDGFSGGYEIGSRWLDTTNNNEYVCLDNATGAAIWKNTTVSGSGTGDVVGPGSSIDWGMVVFNGTTGKIIQDSGKRNYGGSATDPTVPTPADGDIYYNTVLDMWLTYDAVRSKFLSFTNQSFQAGRTGGVPAGAYYRGIDGKTLSSTIGYVAKFDGTLVSFGYTRSNTASANFEIVANGTNLATVASSAVLGYDNTLDANFSQGDVLALRNQTGGNTMLDTQAWFQVRWRV